MFRVENCERLIKERIFIFCPTVYLEQSLNMCCFIFLTSQLMNLLKLDCWDSTKFYHVISIKGSHIRLTQEPEFPEGAAHPTVLPAQYIYIYCLKNITCFLWDCLFSLWHGQIAALFHRQAFWKWVCRKVLLPDSVHFRRRLFFQASSQMWNRKTSTFSHLFLGILLG